MFRRRVVIDPADEPLLTECARRWGITVDEAARWAMHVGLARLSASPVAPDELFDPLDPDVAQSSPIVRLCNALLVTAMDQAWPLLEIALGEEHLTVDVRRGAEKVRWFPKDADAPSLPSLYALRDEAVSRYAERWREALWCRYCVMAEMPFHVSKRPLIGYIRLRHHKQNWCVTVSGRRVCEERRMRLRLVRETR